MLGSCRIEMYRSVRSLRLRLHPVTVLQGANGCGKTNCYRALQLLHAAAQGRLIEHFAEEGGMPSALWAGPRTRKELHEVRMAVAVELEAFIYRLACGLPAGGGSFALDPEVKEEDISVHLEGLKRPVPLVERRALVCTLRDQDGARTLFPEALDPSESVLSQITDPSRFSELALVRTVLQRWRALLPRLRHRPRGRRAAHPRLGFRTTVLSGDGRDLAAALHTIICMGEGDRLRSVLANGLPGMELVIERSDRGLMGVAMHKRSIHRDLCASELSDGTLRFLCLAAALLSPRPAPFIALNEPETSLHADLLPALAELILAAQERSQVLVTTHSSALAEAIERKTGTPATRLELDADGQTRVAGGSLLDT